MTEPRKPAVLAATLVALSVAGGASQTLSAPAPGCGGLANTPLRHAKVTSATLEANGHVCRIAVTSRPTRDSDIGIEVYIPMDAAWNGKFVQAGNGGYAGRVPSAALQALAARGYVAAGTDDGHQSLNRTDASWALGHPEKLVDFGWRALKETTVVAKALIKTAKGRAPTESYFNGCSDGGREALMEAQRFPDDFDGIVAGAPANYEARIMTMRIGMFQKLFKPGAYLDTPQLELLQHAALEACGGTESGFIRDAADCQFDPAELACKAGASEHCLSAAQVAGARAIYAGWHDPRTGKLEFPGYEPGAEAQPAWRAVILGKAADPKGTAAGYRFAVSFLRDFVTGDPARDPSTFDLGAEADAGVAKTAPIVDSEDPDLSAFRKHGKLIQYHGWNDQNIPARSSIRYYEDVSRHLGDPSDFYRLYMVPGMLHCRGGMGPNDVDWLAALDKWVTDGRAPTAVKAKARPLGTAKADVPVPAKSQLLCPYPQVVKLVRGDPGVAESYRCAVR